ncbi:hypothetical protein [Streptomyces sp. NPDC048636]|uniref:hypothetical protein n=1 Tax=Streptomyces sp. NPDC048636 TaxID=3155762 RepID=UPI003436B1B3
MVHGHRTSRSADRRGPCATVLVVLLALTLLHTVLSQGASQTPPPDQGHCGAFRVPAPAAPRAQEETSGAARPAALPVRDGDGHPAGHTGHGGPGGHAGRACATSAPGARSVSAAPGHMVLAAVRGRIADHTTGPGTSDTGAAPLALQFSSRSVVLRC